MKFFRTAIGCTILLAIIVGIWISSLLAPSGPEPAWVEHFDAAVKVRASDNFTEFDRQAKLVLQDAGNYGGALPPQRNMSQDQKLFEGMFFFIPFMQDRGETFSYLEALRDLGDDYKQLEKWDDAELFYRKIMDLRVAEDKRKNPKSNSKPDLSNLIALMEKSGRIDKAIELQKQKVASLKAYADESPSMPHYQTPLLEGQAKLFEMEGKFDEQEKCLKKIVDLYKGELSPENLAKQKAENAKMPEYVNASLMTFQLLDPLEDFYAKHKNFAAQEQILLKKLSLHEAILPENSKHLSRDWSELKRFYEQHGKYSQAERALLQEIHFRGEKDDDFEDLAKIYENEGKHDKAIESMQRDLKALEATSKDKNDIANHYMRYVVLLNRLGKHAEAEQAKKKASELDPAVASASMYTPPESDKYFWKKTVDTSFTTAK